MISGTEPIVTPPITKTEKIKLLSQGAYGCVFHPGPKCSVSPKDKDDKDDKDDYIIKIQRKQETSTNELKISKKIIEKYKKTFSRYFAPILETCPVQFSLIQNDEIQKCEVFYKTPNGSPGDFESNQIKYVGEYSLEEYFENLANVGKMAKSFIVKLANSHIVLLEGLQMLNNIDIVHGDIKDNNIMCTKTTGRPIIIDFGLSIDVGIEPKTTEWWEGNFWSYSPDYGSWCIEMCMISYATNVVRDWNTKSATIAEMKNVINEFITKNSLVADLFQEEEKELLRTRLITYFMKYDQTAWTVVVAELIKFHKTWDNYALAGVYLYIFKDLDLDKYTISYKNLHEYKNLLKEVVTASPETRMSPDIANKKISQIFTSVSRTENMHMARELHADFENKDNAKKRTQQVATSKMADLRRSVHVYRPMTRQITLVNDV